MAHAQAADPATPVVDMSGILYAHYVPMLEDNLGHWRSLLFSFSLPFFILRQHFHPAPWQRDPSYSVSLPRVTRRQARLRALQMPL